MANSEFPYMKGLAEALEARKGELVAPARIVLRLAELGFPPKRRIDLEETVATVAVYNLMVDARASVYNRVVEKTESYIDCEPRGKSPTTGELNENALAYLYIFPIKFKLTLHKQFNSIDPKRRYPDGQPYLRKINVSEVKSAEVYCDREDIENFIDGYLY